MQKTTKGKKRLGAALSALAVGGFMVLMAVCMLTDCFGGGTAGETVAILVAAGMFFLVAGGVVLCVLHNLYFYNEMMREIRSAIDEGRFKEFYNKYRSILGEFAD